MKRSIWLLLACSLAGAIPLHKGENWTWLVVDRETNARQWRTAAVLDSAKHDSGFVWRIQARDSLTKGTDTGSILVRPDGSQNWLVLSRFLPWEPQPLPATSIGIAHYNLDPSEVFPNTSTEPMPSLPWGVASRGASAGKPLVQSWAVTSEPGLRSCRDLSVQGYHEWNCPQQSWDAQLGVVRARIFDSRFGEDWTLLSQNGNAVSQKPLDLVVPDLGASLVWQETIVNDTLPYGTSASITRLRGRVTRTWKILERPSDSGSWIRVRVLETLRTDSSSRDSAFDMRLNASTGERIPSRGKGSVTPDEGWWRDAADSLHTLTETRFRRFHSISYSSSFRPGYSSDDFQSWLRIGPENQIDSLAEISAIDQGEGGGRSWDHTTFTRVLLSVDGKVVRAPDALGVGHCSRNSAPINLSSLVRLHPSLAVRWRDARGRSGQFLACDVGRTGFGKGNGVLYLSAILPDGSRWSGAYLPAMR